jgi:hypothetical protein
MLSWFRSKRSAPREPETCKDNPGEGAALRVAFANGTRSWEESADLIECLARVLGDAGQPHARQKSHISLENGILLLPRVVEFQPLEDGVRTVTTIEASHSERIPPGIFEYQHATGANLVESVTSGFTSWSQLDLPVFLDSLGDDPKTCTMLKMDLPADDIGPKRARRIILGSVWQLAARPMDVPEGEHPFCSCCMFTRCPDAFNDLVKKQGFYGIRFFASRDEAGVVSADCRVNGLDYPAGAAALCRYAETWPQQGLEFRKQFVAIVSE